MATTPKPVKVKPADTSTSSPSSKQPPPEPAPLTPTPVQPANIKPAHDTPPNSSNTVGKIVPQTTPAPKARTKAERDRDIAKYDQERKAALQRGDKAAAEAADLKAAQVMDEPKGLGDVAGEVWGIGSIFMGGGRGKAAKAPAAKPVTVAPAGKSSPAAAPAGTGGYSTGSGNVKEDCGIKPYKKQKCPTGQQAHHIVPDYALRYGTRGDKGKRIPGMPSLADGPSICLSGGSKSQGSDHNKAHEGTDPRIAKEGKRTDNGTLGTAPIGDIIDISIDEVTKVKPHCADEIKTKTNDAFKDVDRNKYGRTTQQPPKSGTQAQTNLERGDSHTSNTPKPKPKGRIR
jgi:hypothetical protein